jgi:hypothetical protein
MESLGEFGATLAAWPLSVALRASSWVYPIIEIVHLAGMALLFGSIVVVDLRLAGLGRQLPVTTLLRHALPASVVGFFAVVASGALLFVAHADELIVNRAFLVKIVLIGLGLANALWFHQGPYRQLHAAPASASWDIGRPPPTGARACAMVSLLTWGLVICAGRLIAYV